MIAPRTLFGPSILCGLLATALVLGSGSYSSAASDVERELAELRAAVAAQAKRIEELEARAPTPVNKAATAESAAIETSAEAQTDTSSTDEPPSKAQSVEDGSVLDEVAELRKRLPFKLGASAWLYYFQPFESADFGGDSNFELYSFYLNIGKEWDNGYGFDASIRMRDSKLRGWQSSNIYAQTVSVHKQTKVGRIEAGTFYKQLGYFWDDSFFGNIQYFDGLKLDPDVGLQLSGEADLAGGWTLPYWGQFFVTDDGYHGGLTGRDAESSVGTRENNTGVLRVAPKLALGDGKSVTFGFSGLAGGVDRSGGEKDNNLVQGALDLELAWGPLLTYGEFLYVDGENSVTFPQPGGSSWARYWLGGVRYQLCDALNLRVNYSRAEYEGGFEEYMWQPGIVWSIVDGLALYTEYNHWQRTGAGSGTIDRSLNLALNISLSGRARTGEPTFEVKVRGGYLDLATARHRKDNARLELRVDERPATGSSCPSHPSTRPRFSMAFWSARSP